MEQKPPDEGDPQTANAGAAKETENSNRDEAEGDHLAGSGRGLCRAVRIANLPPEDRSRPDYEIRVESFGRGFGCGLVCAVMLSPMLSATAVSEGLLSLNSRAAESCRSHRDQTEAEQEHSAWLRNIRRGNRKIHGHLGVGDEGSLRVSGIDCIEGLTPVVSERI